VRRDFQLLRFLGDVRGGVAISFAIAVLPIAAMTGIAVDYTRASDLRDDLQAATDAATLALSRSTLSADQIRLAAKQRMASMLPASYKFEVTSVSRKSSQLSISAEGVMPAGVSGIIGASLLKQKVTSEIVWGTGKLEVALVLDNTGSMAQFSRMTELKKAAHELLDQLASSEAGLAKVAIVPFDVNVKIPLSYRTASWFKTDWWTNWFWKGCMTDRDQPYDVSDAPVTSLSQYPAALCNSDRLVTIRPLTDSFSDLRATVNAMTPAGNTNVTIGLSWGHAILSSQAPFTEGAPPGTPDVTKILVLMTDGDNTENRWTSTASAIDLRTKLACKSVRDAGIELYVIRLMEGSASLLRECASSPSTYYDVQNAQDLVPAFRAIGEKLAHVHLSR
jgi:Flp pilus assembly protein TadG